MGNSNEVVGLDYWLRWQVPVCALILLVPTAISLILINRNDRDPLKFTDLWFPCWRNLNPFWLLLYRVFAFTSMAFVLYQIVVAFGFFVFYFYTQWTFTLVIFYFALATVISARGCWMYMKNPSFQSGEGDKFLKKDSEESKHESKTTYKGINLQGHHSQVQNEQLAGFWGYLMQNVYQTCAGASTLTDIVFWCLLLPFMSGENFQLTVLIGCMHSLNAVFLLIDSTLNSLVSITASPFSLPQY
ncbi:unnamed protein product [Ilex paraguariensis]|uniref:Uncharacterized protein n=1 Tax=Ilex paraguariensis TaxID=185542 RepID=A0ABC8SEB1_9AQUA